MTKESQADALATIRALHELGATHVIVGSDHVEVKFDRIFVPVLPKHEEPKPLGPEVTISTHEYESLRDEVESLRSRVNSATALGLI